MKSLALTALLFLAVSANAAVRDWESLISKATPEEQSDPGKILRQIRIVPAKDPNTGKVLFKVVAVEKGSVFDREGVQVGDLLSIEDRTDSAMTIKAQAR